MNTFAFYSRAKLGKHYLSFFNKIKKHQYIRDSFKITLLVFGLLFFLFFYLYYVNLSSTRGYFLRQANQERSATFFSYQIVKTKLLKIRQKNRQIIKENSWLPAMNTMSVMKIIIPETEF